MRSMVTMRALLATLLVLAVSSSGARADDWTRTDTVLQAAALTTLAVDYLQTRQLVRDRIETNPLIGACGGMVHPDGCGRVSPELYFAAVAALHIAAARLLPAPWRHVLQGVTIGVEAHAITRNYEAGYTLRF